MLAGMSEHFANASPSLSDPALHAAAVTTSNTVDLAEPARCLWVGVSGDVKVDMLGGESGVTFKGVQGLLPVLVTRVYATGTTATDIVALR